MAPRFTIVGLGEALFDLFPDAQVLGGAPLNVAIHAHQLASPVGGRGVIVSRVGQDHLGDQIIAELRERGMDPSWVQTDPDRDTGRVYVNIDAQGEPQFEIAGNAAWDWLNFDPEDETLARSCDAVCFGSLAQREAQARNAIYRFLAEARHAIRMFDVNLRQNYHDARTIARSCEMSTVVKLNTAELPVVCRLIGLDASDEDAGARALLDRFKLRHVVLTRGEKGTVIYSPQGKVEGAAASYPRAENADPVGAGDACSAGLLYGLVRRWPLQRTADLANHMGAFVASVAGATPKLPQSILDMAK